MRTPLLLLLAALPVIAVAQPVSGTLIKKLNGTGVEDSIEGLLVGFGQASVSAAGLAKVGGDAVTTVENVRDFAVAIKGDTPLSKKVFGVAITSARTSLAFPRLSLEDYAGKKLANGKRENHWGNRLLGSLTFSYAQGESPIDAVDFQRRAVAVETSLYIDPNDDPVVAFANEDCMTRALQAAAPLPAGAAASPATPPRPTQPGAVVPKRRDASAALEAYQACVNEALAELDLRWNRSRVSASFGTGWIQRADSSGAQQGLGRTFAVGLVWGFDGVSAMPQALRDNGALSLVVRRSRNEPVLKSLLSGPVSLNSSTLVATRFAAGSASFRALVEFSNAKSRDITTSQTTFRRAVGLDYRVAEGWWLNVRSGKQRKLDGSGDEVGSFLSVNYSPKPDLKLGL